MFVSEPSRLDAACFHARNHKVALSALAAVTLILSCVSIVSVSSADGPSAKVLDEILPPVDGDPMNSPHESGVLLNPTEISKQSYPGYPQCQDRLAWMQQNWNSTDALYQKYHSAGVDGSVNSILNYLNQHGLYCPTADDANRKPIHGVSIGGWLVLEPWIVPSLFEQFDPADNVVDMWKFCEVLGPAECQRQLNHHYDTFLTLEDVTSLAEGGINHVRIPVGYWIMGDIRAGEPWVPGALAYLQRAMHWFKKYDIKVLFDLHCAPGSQNGFDNSGRKGEIHWADPSVDSSGNTFYPNIDRSLTVIEGLVSLFSLEPFQGTVKYIELVNEAFITIPIDVVKSFYTRGYEAVRRLDPTIGIVIGDSFRFGAWQDFMYPPNYNHVYIDTHIYQVFDTYRLSMTTAQHIDQTCNTNLPEVAVAPLSTIVGEFCGAMNDCAQWLNGYGSGARYDGTFASAPNPAIGSCVGYNDTSNKDVWTPSYKADLRRYVEAQMDAYESGSAMGWFFWNFKTERAPQWNYLLGVEMGWIPKPASNRTFTCSSQ